MSSSITSPINSAKPSFPQTHPTVAVFDKLPESAFGPLCVVCALFCCSPATVWRRVRAGQLASPHRIGLRTTRWRVSDLRKDLAAPRGGEQ